MVEMPGGANCVNIHTEWSRSGIWLSIYLMSEHLKIDDRFIADEVVLKAWCEIDSGV